MAQNMRDLFEMDKLEKEELYRDQISFRELAACIRAAIAAPKMGDVPITLILPKFIAAQIADMMDYCGDLFLGGIPEDVLPEPLTLQPRFVEFKDTDSPGSHEES